MTNRDFATTEFRRAMRRLFDREGARAVADEVFDFLRERYNSGDESAGAVMSLLAGNPDREEVPR